MKKYSLFFSLAWKRALVYRGVGLIYLLLALINTSLNIAVWTVAYQNSQFRSTESFSTFITYFLLVIFFNQLVNSFTGGVIADEHIKRGELSIYLLKPFSYFFYMIILEIPWRIIAFITSLPVILIMRIIYGNLITFQWQFLILALLLIGLTFTLSFIIQVFFASFTFWLDDTHGIFDLLEILVLLFSGVGIPLFFFPEYLRWVSNVLPFQYILYLPVSIALGKLNFSQIGINVILLGGWILLLSSITRWLWRNGLKKFTGEGI